MSTEVLVVSEACSRPGSPDSTTSTGTGTRRAPLTGWLTKRKSDSSHTRFICSANKRYFTLDFRSQILYYAHSDSCKAVSVPTPFRDILGIEPFAATVQEEECEEEGQLTRSSSKGSLASGFRMPFLAKKSAEQHGFVIRTVGKCMELLCSSKAEAETWIAAVNEAIEIAAHSGGPRLDDCNNDAEARAETSTAAGSSRRTSPSPRSVGEEHNALSPNEELKSSSSGSAGDDGVPQTKAKRRMFGLLPAKMTRAGASEVKTPQDTPRPPSSSMPQVEKTESTGVVDMLNSSMGGECNAWASQVEDRSSPDSVSKRYADKGQGLSIHQRLSQLDFSDDEDEDEDKPCARGTAARKSPAPSAPSPPPKPESVVVEQCTSFVQEPDSDDD